ncbi:MAG: DNA helicase UvrD [Zetaproteobacteria bacterium CG12_big_fil_rev_8_21_14_0_65_55_1124]|nr:MAG: DNA helicase UvrD [Zetaproteobacteria bacterium CG1_02_55_237]PIS19681.1 MAG: DNA helicase UvrD [Zetaproteobacteria bacterium CG08_land_8_20_14_0_20_55_17]PIW42786.1 MAG: DNA helicase UvrD [Zetaproteobacteria bacterium CG12_big_fil_rev_8_21_14_0_65_55_1124]PIY54010.1 MAG: DNA helicase UvrD [Zetaproteobacteria bacterium CG_4_10_14_0_8_um_filter_55_43]PIZ39590.1 MAG: DNA helicase UvrD [Zetaproteobacteria bacterium CG_4_10_14_0_2_um_filter_55_20]PJB79023.1 MAG: DNA helicase UvrD [Zetaprot
MSAEVRAAAIDPAGSFLVQAPAGSGKTELLTRRILKLLSVVEEPEEILALTFTRKAATEMRGRVVEALTMPKPENPDSHRMETWLLACEANARSEARGWHLAQHPSRLRMMTLDSFTHSLARQLPLLSGLGGMPSPSSNVAPLYRQAAEAAVAMLVRRSAAQAAAVLLHQDHNMVALIELVADMLGKRDQWLHEVEQYVGDTNGLRTMLEQGLAEIMQQKLAECGRMVPIEVRGEMPALLRIAGKNLEDVLLCDIGAWPGDDLQSLALWQRIASLLLTKNDASFRKRVDKNTGFPADKSLAPAKQAFQEMLALLADIDGLAALLHEVRSLPAAPRFDDGQWQVLEAQLSLLLLANTQLQRLFEQGGEADFIEIALRAMRALEDEHGCPTDLLLRLDYRIHHILVDEFQDTSKLQMRLLRNLTEGWQGGDGTHRTLFMVGDPMQSIYRFRKAEVSLFLMAALNHAELPYVEALHLSRNFRSSPDIVAWVNRAFSRIFPDEPDILMAAVGYAEADAALTHDGAVHLYVQEGRDAAGEAAAVLATVCDELAKPEQRIAVLARSRKHLHAIMQALQDGGIAFRAVEILPLRSRPEIRLLRALTHALLHPADRESWAALLRAPCCGLDTDALHRLLAGDMRPVVAILADEARLNRLDENARSRVHHLSQALDTCLAFAGRVRLRPLLEQAWNRLGMPGVIEEDAARNVEAMLELVEELDEGGWLRFDLLDERLEKLYAAPDASEAAARVELLTMHGAKGLQWDVVILPGLGLGTGRGDDPLLAFTEVPVGDDVQPLIAVRGAVRSSDDIYRLVRSVEKVRANNEQARLLYVACTRAQTSLHLFGHVSEGKGEAGAASLLRLLLPQGMDSECFGAQVHVTPAGPDAALHALPQLTRMQTLPAIFAAPENDSEAESEYLWAGPEAASIGKAVHAALQDVGEGGVEQWSERDTAAELARVRRLLLADGLSGATLEEAVKRSATALSRVLSSKRGRWLLSGVHNDAYCEWMLSGCHEGLVSHHVIDRSFVDADGVRWVVDYKTASHQGGNQDAFLAMEVQRHGAQLARYASLLSEMEPERQVRTALYFPMMDAWVVVD